MLHLSLTVLWKMRPGRKYFFSTYRHGLSYLSHTSFTLVLPHLFWLLHSSYFLNALPKRHMMWVHFESFTGFTVHHSSSVTFFPLTLAFFYSAVIKSSIRGHVPSSKTVCPSLSPPLALAFNLSLHRHPYLCIPLRSRSIRFIRYINTITTNPLKKRDFLCDTSEVDHDLEVLFGPPRGVINKYSGLVHSWSTDQV